MHLQRGLNDMLHADIILYALSKVKELLDTCQCGTFHNDYAA